MQLLEVFTPDLDTYVRYKILDPDDVDQFVQSNRSVSKETYVRKVLELVVYNLRSSVADALKTIDKLQARDVLESVYHGCVMLNPGLDVDCWIRISTALTKQSAPKETPPSALIDDEVPPPLPPEDQAVTRKKPATKRKKPARKRITKAKFRGLEPYLREHIIGQDEAITSVVNALKRSIVGLGDTERPLGVFLFAGASGVGKTQLAKELHSYLFGDDVDMVRIDCGEYQHKHENQKLIGSPPGYVGYDDGGHLTKQMAKNGHTVVLLDEVEKAHPDVWNTFLRVFDEGLITDSSGKVISFRDSIIVMTTNLGNQEAVGDMLDTGTGFNRLLTIDFRDAEAPPREKVERYTMKAIRKSFRPEFLNRIDRTVVFNHLTGEELITIAQLELQKLETKLSKKGISLNYGRAVLESMVKEGVNPIEGARGLSRVRRDTIENTISDTLLETTRWPRGSVLTLTIDGDGSYAVEAKKPVKAKES